MRTLKAKIVLLLVVCGVALAALVFTILRKPAAAQPSLVIQPKPAAAIEAPAPIIPPAVAPPLVASPPVAEPVEAKSVEAITAAAVAITPPLPPPTPAVRNEPLAITPTAATRPQKGQTEIAIQDSKSYNFSGGRPTASSSAADKKAIDDALREIDLATKDLTVPAASGGDGKR